MGRSKWFMNWTDKFSRELHGCVNSTTARVGCASMLADGGGWRHNLLIQVGGLVLASGWGEVPWSVRSWVLVWCWLQEVDVVCGWRLAGRPLWTKACERLIYKIMSVGAHQRPASGPRWRAAEMQAAASVFSTRVLFLGTSIVGKWREKILNYP
jgi:hypothetical protein